MKDKRYSELMGETKAYLSITLDLREPVEIIDFARLFASLGKQFDDYVAANHPELKGEAKMYVRKVREGSIIAELIPNMDALIQHMDQILIVTGFASLLSRRVRRYIMGNPIDGVKKSDVAEIADMVKSVAKDSDGKATVETVAFRKGIWERELAITFDTKQAQKAVETLEAQKLALDHVGSADASRKLMVFVQSNTKKAEPGKRTSERVMIEEISEKDLPLVYGSQLAEERIKHEITEADDNIYKKGFIVDVNVQTRNGKPAAYAVTHVHQVFDLPET